LVRSLLARFDLLYLDPLDPAISGDWRSVCEAALKRRNVYPALIERGKAFREGWIPCASPHGSADFVVFVLDGGHRVALKRQGDQVLERRSSYSVGELAAMAERIFSNALLRPCVAGLFVPTVAYVGGPAELAYFAQSEVLYSRLLETDANDLPRNDSR